VKKWLALILFFITAAGSFIPCCVVDDCCADKVNAACNHEKHQDECACSPFFACTTCSVSVELPKPIQLIQPLIEKPIHHEQVVIFDLNAYAASFWQPPRCC
jgi:hypothetical protein